MVDHYGDDRPRHRRAIEPGCATSAEASKLTNRDQSERPQQRRVVGLVVVFRVDLEFDDPFHEAHERLDQADSVGCHKTFALTRRLHPPVVRYDS